MIRLVALLLALMALWPSWAQADQDLPPKTALLQSRATQAQDGEVLEVLGYSISVLTISVEGSPTFTIAFEGTAANSPITSLTPFFSIACTPLSGGTDAVSVTTTGSWRCISSGLTHIRARVTSFSGGTSVTVTGAAIEASASISSGSSGGGGGGGTVNQGNPGVDSLAWPVKLADSFVGPSTLSAVDQTLSIPLAGRSGAVVALDPVTATLTIVPEVSLDGGANWIASLFVSPSTMIISTQQGFTAEENPSYFGILAPAGATNARVRVSAHTSGSVSTRIQAVTINPAATMYATDTATIRALVAKDVAPGASDFGLLVRCVSGCGGTGGASGTDDSNFVVGTGAVNPIAGIFRVTRDQVDDTDMGALAMTQKRALLIVPETPNGDLMVDENADAARVSVVTAISAMGFNRQGSGSLGALNAVVVANSEGTGQLTFEIDSGTLSGTVVFEATLDDGTWFAISAVAHTAGNNTSYRINSASSFPVRGYILNTGWSQVRIRVSAYTSGSSNARLEVSPGAGVVRNLPIFPGEIWSAPQEYTTQQTDAVLKAAPGAGFALYITDLTLRCNAAVTVTIEAGGSTLVDKHYCSGQGDGFVQPMQTPIKLADNTSLTVTSSGAVTIFVRAQGYTAAQ